MMRSVFLKSLRDQTAAMLGWGLILASLSAFTLLFFPAMADQTKAYDELLKSMPEITSFLGNVTTMGTVEGFVTYGLLSYLPLVLSIYVLMAAVRTITGEIDTGTMDFLLSHPIPRWRATAEKAAALVVAVVVICGLFGIGLWIGGLAIRSDISGGQWLLAGLNVAPLTLFFGSLTFAVACATRGSSAAYGVAGTVVIVSFVANGLVPLIKSLAPYREWTIYYLFAASKPLSTGVIWGHVAILLAASLVLLAAGIAAFQRRDILA